MSLFRGSNSPETDWSVPVQRTPYPARQPEGDDPTTRLYLPEDPVEPDDPEPAEEPVPAREPRLFRLALAVAVLALLAAAGAWAAALRAGARADEAAAALAAHTRAAV